MIEHESTLNNQPLSIEQKLKLLREAIAKPFEGPESVSGECCAASTDQVRLFFNDLVDLEAIKRTRRRPSTQDLSEVVIELELEPEQGQDIELEPELESKLESSQKDYLKSISPTPSSNSIPVRTPSGRTLRSNIVNADEPRRLRSNK